jgi:hypothetical protein
MRLSHRGAHGMDMVTGVQCHQLGARHTARSVK